MDGLQHFGELLLIAKDVEPGESRKLVVVAVKYFGGELGLYLFQDELAVQEFVSKLLYLRLIISVGNILVKLTVKNDLLDQRKML